MSQFRKRTILQVIPSLEAGGAERATVDIAGAFVAAGHRALVASTGGYMLAELQKKGGVHITKNVDSKNPLVIIANAFWLMGMIGREKIDIIHARSRAPAWSAYIAARLTGTPFVTTFHAAYKGSFFLKKLYNSVMAKGDRVIAISGFIARHIKKNFGVSDKLIRIIPRGIDMSVYSADLVQDSRKNKLKEEWQWCEGMPIIIMPARLSSIKGHALVLEALGRLKHLDFICVFIGPDQGRSKYRDTLLAAVRDFGLQEKIKWMEGGDVPAAYSVAQLVLSPSQVAEGFGRVPVEAQAFGVPVIATALGATDETILNNETGWLVPEGNVDALTQAIEAALSLAPDARLLMSEKAKAFVRKTFDAAHMCAATLAVYEEIVKK